MTISIGRFPLAVLLLATALGWRPAGVLAATQGTTRSAQQATHGLTPAPSGPPLVDGSAGFSSADADEESANDGAQSEADPLVSNGLGSPLCKGSTSDELSESSRRNCETSGFVAAPAPTGNYGLDVHIDTGVLGLSSGGLLSAVQDLFVTPLWMALVWAVHALVVMLEWSFQLDLLDSPATGGVGRSLREAQAVLTEPWLALVLSVAAILAAYNGLVRRRVSETLGETLLMGAMIVGGMSVMLDPTGTVGALGRWANQASLGALAVAASGAPVTTDRALGDSMGTLFTAVIEAPWCYLEFGDVGWCREPRQLDASLRSAAVKIAEHEQSQAGCEGDAGSLPTCATSESAQASSLTHSAELLRGARSNGQIFLALPANGPARNSINEEGSLLRTLCQSSEATACQGSTAAQAEFRTNGGTWARVGGLLLIVAGVLGMLLLLGFVTLRLLASALLALVFLLLAPAAVLAPALGENGRAAFRAWLTRLLGAVLSKLIYSFVLGVVLAVLAILVGLRGLGWWTQWLLMSAFWWAAYARRHQLLGLVGGAVAPERPVAGGSGLRRMTGNLSSRQVAMKAAGWARGRRSKPPPDVRPPATLPRTRREQITGSVDGQVARSLQRDYSDARARVAEGAGTRARLAELRARLQRIHRERQLSSARGDTRRTAKLDVRAARVAGEIADHEEALRTARRTVTAGERSYRRIGATHSADERAERAQLLDAQAAHPPNGLAGPAGRRRDYVALAGLAGYGRDEYRRLDPVSQRGARLQIDRELAVRRELGPAANAAHRSARPSSTSVTLRAEPALRERRSELDPALPQPARHHGDRPPSSRVMDDAREVAARRKRQLGSDRP